MKAKVAIWAILLAVALVPTCLSAQPTQHDWYITRVEHHAPIEVISLTSDDGSVRVTVPDHIFTGERFYGTVELPPEGASTATQSYLLHFGEEVAAAKNGKFSWQAPIVSADTDVPLLVTDFRGARVALATLTVYAHPAVDGQETPLYIPRIAQAGRPLVISGSFDGTGAGISLDFGSEAAELITQSPHESVFMVPHGLLGKTNYAFAQNGKTRGGVIRCMVLEQRLGSTSLRNAANTPYQLVVRGLAEIDREVAISFRNETPTLASFGPARVAPKNRKSEPAEIIYFPHDSELVFIQPAWVQKDGTFRIDRVLTGIQPGEIRVSAFVVVPADMEEEVSLLLKMARQNFTDLPGQEHAAIMRERYGDRAMQLLESVLDRQPDFGEAADAMLYLDADAAAPAIFRAIGRKPIYNWDFALDWYMRKLDKDANYRFRKELHTAATQIIEAAPTVTAVRALVQTGSAADVPILEQAYMIPDLHPVNRNMVEAALGRYGNETAVQAIEKKLSVVVAEVPPGLDFRWATEEAAFTQSARLIPALCRHLHDRSWDFGDYSVAPASDAAAAIEQIRKANKNIDPQQLECSAEQKQ